MQKILNFCFERNLVGKKNILKIEDLESLSKSKKNTHIKFLMGNKLLNAINIEAHSASESVMKEFKRLGAEIKIVKFTKKKLITKKDDSLSSKTEKISNKLPSKKAGKKKDSKVKDSKTKNLDTKEKKVTQTKKNTK